MTVEETVKIVSQWLQIREHNRLDTRSPDADHSALLRRLLQGKPALPVPPPKFYSYPCYAAAEGKAVRVEAWKHGEQWIIGQHDEFEPIDATSRTFRHKPTGDHYTLRTEEGLSGAYQVIQKVQG